LFNKLIMIKSSGKVDQTSIKHVPVLYGLVLASSSLTFRGTRPSVEMLKGCMVRERLRTPVLDDCDRLWMGKSIDMNITIRRGYRSSTTVDSRHEQSPPHHEYYRAPFEHKTPPLETVVAAHLSPCALTRGGRLTFRMTGLVLHGSYRWGLGLWQPLQTTADKDQDPSLTGQNQRSKSDNYPRQWSWVRAVLSLLVCNAGLHGRLQAL